MAGIKDTFSKGLATINVKTSTYMEENKIKTHISSLNEAVDTLYKEIGEGAYLAWKNGTPWSFDKVSGKLSEIDAKRQEIQKQEQRIEALHAESNEILGIRAEKGTNCPRCGFENPAGNLFCTKCGFKLS